MGWPQALPQGPRIRMKHSKELLQLEKAVCAALSTDFRVIIKL